MSDQLNANQMQIDVANHSKSVSNVQSMKYINSSDIFLQTFDTAIESKMIFDGSTSIPIDSNPSSNVNCNTLVISYPLAIQNSFEFWDSAIRNAKEVDVRIHIPKKQNY